MNHFSCYCLPEHSDQEPAANRFEVNHSLLNGQTVYSALRQAAISTHPALTIVIVIPMLTQRLLHTWQHKHLLVVIPLSCARYAFFSKRASTLHCCGFSRIWSALSTTATAYQPPKTPPVKLTHIKQSFVLNLCRPKKEPELFEGLEEHCLLPNPFTDVLAA